jgi:protein IQ-DOMAIN 14 (fragment)
VTFTGYADFSETTFTQADFSSTTFTRRTDFSGATFKYEPIFVYTLGNKTYKARFSYKVNPKNYKFDVSPKSCKIETEEQEHNGTKFIIPKGTILFDPDELSEQEDNDSNDS